MDIEFLCYRFLLFPLDRKDKEQADAERHALAIYARDCFDAELLMESASQNRFQEDLRGK
ncbi:MAG: hypothetical protein K5905_09120 [Roseibium sp.]|uniref:hypothetical protein n=1 Tax=Roseibium sp. TaxID=1936156 RepID=UPI00260B747F|nr:hypothetical protein [Roseibium sp.]MCV0425623.1 hypothetical protein [Roseibium sp.]